MWSLWQFFGVWLGVSAVSYAMFLVAYVFESRRPGGIGPGRVPVWRYQSRAFLPGDFGLALFITSGLCLFSQAAPPHLFMYEWSGDHWRLVTQYRLTDWSVSWWWQWLVAPLLSLAVLYIGRRVLYKADDYTPTAWRSPSKRYHDYVMYGMVPLAVVWWVIPGYMAGSFDPVDTSITLVAYVGALGLVLWAGCVILDTDLGNVPNEHQHPTVWRPIWRT